jgi:hypothetical protein
MKVTEELKVRLVRARELNAALVAGLAKDR